VQGRKLANGGGDVLVEEGGHQLQQKPSSKKRLAEIAFCKQAAEEGDEVVWEDFVH